jgi:hypothetical protein
MKYTETELLDIWESIGNRNIFIRNAVDPPFSKRSFEKCESLNDMYYFLNTSTWCLGQGFYYQNLCIINQMNGGDEWLVIKDSYVIDSFSFDMIIRKGRFFQLMEKLLSK